MDKIEVKLISITPEKNVNLAISKPYRSEPATSLTEKVIVMKKHLSCAEHIVMCFDISGVSRSELQEHMRHRISSATVESTRFSLFHHITDDCRIDDLFVYPEMKDDQKNLTFQTLLSSVYSTAIEAIKVGQKEGIPNDYLKYMLPEGFRTRFVWTINFRSFLNFLELRLSPTAHFEIRAVAQKCLDAIWNNPEAKYLQNLLKNIIKEKKD